MASCDKHWKLLTWENDASAKASLATERERAHFSQARVIFFCQSEVVPWHTSIHAAHQHCISRSTQSPTCCNEDHDHQYYQHQQHHIDDHQHNPPAMLRKKISICGVWWRAIFCTRDLIGRQLYWTEISICLK